MGQAGTGGKADVPVAFFTAFGVSLVLLMLFCMYALKRGPHRRLWPCLSRRGAGPASTSQQPAGPDYAVWATAATGAPGDWGQKVYLTDLKRQSIAHRLSQPGFDQRVMDWRSYPQQAYTQNQNQNQYQQRWSYQSSSHPRSPLGSGSGSPAQTRVSPASTFRSSTHILPPATTTASTLSPARPKRGSSLPSSPLAATAAKLTTRERESFGHTPSMYAVSSSRGSIPASREVAVPPLAKVAYSPFAPRGSLLSLGAGAPAQRGSMRSERGFAV